jgi:hypothetical protein
VSGDVRVFIDNLPDTHEVKSIRYGARDITHGTFRLSDANFPTAPGTPIATTPAYSSALSLFTSQLTLLAGVATAPLKPAVTAPSTISITIGLAKRSSSGVRITGRTGSTNRRQLYISGKPGVLYSDGTFEFRDVAPGLHLIAAMSIPRPLAALVNVGSRDIDGIELQETPFLPNDALVPKDPSPSGEHAPGVVPLPRVRGIVVNESTRVPVGEGEVEIGAGDNSRRVPIDTEGRFETFYLLPGTYDFKTQIFGHSQGGTLVTIDHKDLTIELSSRRLY